MLKKSFYQPKVDKTKKSYSQSIVVPYNPCLNNIKNLLNKKEDINLAFNYPNKIYNYIVNVNLKSKTESNQYPGVYQIPCLDCDSSYFGQTGRNLDTRVLEHRRSVRYGQDNNALFVHINNTGHRIDWDNADMIIKSNCSFKRKLIESFYINTEKNFNISTGQWNTDLGLKLVMQHLTEKEQ